MNVKRRNLSKSQTAIAAAEAWGMNDYRKGEVPKLADAFAVGKSYVTQARALLELAPDLAEAVKGGHRALAEAMNFHKSWSQTEAGKRFESILTPSTRKANGKNLPFASGLTNAEVARSGKQRKGYLQKFGDTFGVNREYVTQARAARP